MRKIFFFAVTLLLSHSTYGQSYPPPPGGSDTPPEVQIEEDDSVPPPPPPKPVMEEPRYYHVQEEAEFPGGQVAMYDFISKNLVDPKNAVIQGVEGRSIIRFIIMKDSTISDISVAKSFDAECDQAAIDVIKKMPKWKPGLLNGNPINSTFFLPFSFKLEKPSNVEVGAPIIEMPPASIDNEILESAPEVAIDTNRIYDITEIRPEFPGGIKAMFDFIHDHLVYPENASKNNLEGRVIVQFIIRRDGTISDINILKGFDKECDQAAVDVIKKMPNWKPGKQSGVPVNSKYVIPIAFKTEKH